MESLSDRLQLANASRLRAWQELAAIRALLAPLAESMEPPTRPRCFVKEGAILRDALARAILGLARELAELQRAVERCRPYLSHAGVDGLPEALILLNRASSAATQALPAPGALEGLRECLQPLREQSRRDAKRESRR